MKEDIKLPEELQEVLSKIDIEKAKAEIELLAFRKEFSKIEVSYLNKFRKLQEDFKQEIVHFLEERDLDQEGYNVYRQDDGFYVGKEAEEDQEEEETDPLILELLEKYRKDNPEK